MEIYLVRHTSVDVPAGYAYGQTDVPLRHSFEDEAEVVKETLSAHTFDKVWSSPLTRCVRLATIAVTQMQKRKTVLKKSALGNGK